jgi:uncharacterized protein YcsI (UPF0317 family)
MQQIFSTGFFMNQDISPAALRQAIRTGEFTGNTSGYSPGFVQCNLAIPARRLGLTIFCASVRQTPSHARW